MSIYDTTAENATETDTAVESNKNNPEITGPHMEPPEISNVTTYWRCSDCGYESIHEKDLSRTSFHAVDCAHSEGEH